MHAQVRAIKVHHFRRVRGVRFVTFAYMAMHTVGHVVLLLSCWYIGALGRLQCASTDIDYSVWTAVVSKHIKNGVLQGIPVHVVSCKLKPPLGALNPHAVTLLTISGGLQCYSRRP